ncbi:MAG: efflux transporter periplasmic adaptor subunit [Planctomycetota bacterium]|nr:MAG: efflux transporter periplasmic adaptor subunit [Planctomycetota bacterium]
MSLCPSREALLLSALALLPIACEEPNEYVAPPPPSVTVAQPEQRVVTDYLEFTGRMVSFAEADLVARVEGVLETVDFKDGDLVQAGQLLFTIDDSEYLADVQSAEAKLAGTVASLALAEATLTRKQKAAETNAVSEIDVLEAQAEQDGAEADKLGAEADLVRARLDLEWTRVLAPFDGRMSRSLVDPGNLVGANERTVLARIVQADPIFAEFDMNERDLLRLIRRKSERGGGADLKAELEQFRTRSLELGLANNEDYPYSGTIHYADPDVDPGTGTLLLRGIFDNPIPRKLIPGVFARVRTPLDEREALLLPESALGTDQAGKYALIVGKDGIVEHRPVVLGMAEHGMVVIEKGLGPYDQVVVKGLLRARPGSQVSAHTEGGSAPATDAR